MGEAPMLSAPDEAVPPRSASAITRPGTKLSISDLFGMPYNDARTKLIDTFEDQYLRDLLERSDGSVSKAARDAKMNRSYLTKLLRARGIRIKRIAGEDA
jgi:DNA-binding NtrC family response regulator